MKLNTLDHPKTLDLCDRLNASLAQTLGHLTLLWAFTARKSPRGDVGKWPNGAIARACDWQGDASAFVTALVEAGFLDPDPEHRLIVHDWHEHAERWVRSSLARSGQEFVVANTSGNAVATTVANNDATPCPAQPCPDNPSGRARKRALPPDFRPNEKHRRLAAERGVSLEAEFEQFADYHKAKGSTMKDWDAALNTWIRKAKQFGGTQPVKPSGEKKTDDGKPDFHRMNESELLEWANRLGVRDEGEHRPVFERKVRDAYESRATA